MLVLSNNARDLLDTIHLLRSERHLADATGRHEPEGLTGISGKTRGRSHRAPGKDPRRK
jgi:hypothetical protein